MKHMYCAPLTPSGRATSARWWARTASVVALLWVVAARIAGPSDLWDQTQPRTISYTVDIIAGKRWILPREPDGHAATKPPLYNWLAVPAVRAMGFTSELAHRLPSLVALVACWALTVGLGRAVGGALAPVVGWWAGMMLVSNYTVFKLGYLARPDMLLTFWLIAGFAAATTALLRAREGRPGGPWALALWLCVALAALTKGPAALVLPAYTLVAGLVLGGGRGAGWSWGPLLALVIFGAWVGAVAVIDRPHLVRELWFNECVGRVTGLGPEGADGPAALITTLPNMIVYYLVRFAPWSVLSIAGMIVLARRRRGGGERRWQRMGRGGALLAGAAIFTLLVIGLYSLSAGKRADYLAPALPTGSVVAAWWVQWRGRRLEVTRTWLLPALAALVLAGMTVRNEIDPRAPVPRFGDEMVAFAREVSAIVGADEVITCGAGATPVPALLGIISPDGSAKAGYDALDRRLDAGEAFWVVSARGSSGRPGFRAWIERRREGWMVRECVASKSLPRTEGWPGRLTLYRVEPNSSPRAGGSDKPR